MTEQCHFSWIEKEAKKDYVKSSQRGGEMASVIGILLVTFFFYAHQAWSTGFFTSSFGTIEAFFLYGSILLGIVAPLVRATTGRRNKSRPPEMIVSVFCIVASVWLLMVFPFDFAHFADIVPDFLRFLVNWISNDIARVLIILGTVGGIVFIVVNAVLFFKVRALLDSNKV